MFNMMKNTPEIAITGNYGKTTTKEMLASILETRWNILKTIGNDNLPLHIKETLQRRKTKHQAVLLELELSKPGAGHLYGKYIKPDIVVFTSIDSATCGNLGDNVRSTAESKSVLSQYMKKNGLVLINNDDKNSAWIDTSSYHGQILTIGIHEEADYTATKIRYVEDGMEFSVRIDDSTYTIFIPAYGFHNVYYALFAIAIAHQLGFSIREIMQGLKKYARPKNCFNMIKLRSEMLLIDDTVEANPESVKSAIDVLVHLGKKRKKIVVLGSMLELGEYMEEAHLEIGKYMADKQIAAIYTYGTKASWVRKAAVENGFPADKIHCFESRTLLHGALFNENYENCIMMVKGSASMEMHNTVNFLRSWFNCFVQLSEAHHRYEVLIHPRTLERMENVSSSMILHFGNYLRKLRIKQDPGIPLDVIRIPRKLSDKLMIPDLPYDHYMVENHLHLGPIIGFNVLQRYYDNPDMQLIRMTEYHRIKGLLFIFRAIHIQTHSNTIVGKYYDPKQHTFIEGTFPYPSAIFNRVHLLPEKYKRMARHIGNKVFNYPYRNTDKWKFWVTLSKDPVIKMHLPKTIKYTGENSLYSMLNQYKRVYLKPTTLSGGAGILSLWETASGITIKNEFGQEWTVHSRNDLKLMLEIQLMKNKTYIVQEGIVSEFDLGKVDFRIYIQKDQTGKWKFTGLESKIGKKGSIIANSRYRLKIMPGKEALSTFYNLDDEQISNMMNKMTSLGIRILEEMERSHRLLGDAALDLIVDKSLAIRILEVQFNYAAEIKQDRTQDEREVLRSILPTPWEYAKYLAGFTPYGGGESDR